jgi:hypothetical protein
MAGGGYGQSKSSNKGFSESGLAETSLSKEQAEVLKVREAQYQEYFFPEIIAQLDEAKLKNADIPLFAKTARGIEAGANTSRGQLSKSMAKRGITDGGMAASGELSIEQGKGAAMADAYFNAQLAQKQQIMSVLQMGGAMSPTPTTAAPIGSYSESMNKGHSESFNTQGSVMK